MLTGPDFHEDHVLDDGTLITLRHIRPDDAAELMRGFSRLSPTSRARRFLSSPTTLSDETLRYLTCVDGHDHVAIVAAKRDPSSDREIGLGVARFVRAADNPEVAEVALTVLDEVQRKGLGRILAIAIARAAIERGVKRFRGEVLTDNPGVRELLDEVGAVVYPGREGSLVFEVELVRSEEATGHPLEVVAQRILRAAASHLPPPFRALVVPPSVASPS